MNQVTTYTRLSLYEREEISRALTQGMSIRGIASSLGRNPSTVSRELSRLRYSPRYYRATFAEEVSARKRNHRAMLPPKLIRNPRLRAYVLVHLRIHWSPEQVAAGITREYPADTSMRVSHETIYAYIYRLPKGKLRTELIASLRHRKWRRGPHRRNGPATSTVPSQVSRASQSALPRS